MLKATPRAVSLLSVVVILIAMQSGSARSESLLQASANPLPATKITAADIQATLQQEVIAKQLNGTRIRVVEVGGQHVEIELVHRPRGKTYAPGVHERVTEVYHVLEGVGMQVTEGTLVPKKGIQGGVSTRIAKGDVVIIPARTPHWFSEITEDLTYINVRFDPDRTLPLK